MAQSAYDKTIMGGPPFFDDFDEDKRFLKILFRPGRPLQSREVTQLQSMDLLLRMAEKESKQGQRYLIM